MPQQQKDSLINVTVPNGATPGMVLSVQTAHGMHQITLPPGAVAGQILQVSVPAPQSAVHAIQAPVEQVMMPQVHPVQQSQQKTVQIVLPQGATPGTALQFPLSDGRLLDYTVKEGEKGGDIVNVPV
eukprot:g8949.t1